MSEAVVALRLPVATLPEIVLPGTVITLGLTDPAVRRAIEASTSTGASRSDRRVVLRNDRSELAVIAHVPDVGALPSGEAVAIVRVDSRVHVGAIHESDRGATYADVTAIEDARATPRVEATTRELRTVLGEIAEIRRSRRLPELLATAPAPGALADGIAAWADFDADAKLRVLEAVDVETRIGLIDEWARTHLAELRVQQTIRDDVTEDVDRQHREYLLRQQLAAIRKELGEGDGDLVDDYRTKLGALQEGEPALSESVYSAIAKEIDRLERTSAQGPEHGWIVNWLDRMFELPWGERSDDTVDLDAAQRILDEDHAGLSDVKDRIVEYLAVRALASQRTASADDADSVLDESAAEAAAAPTAQSGRGRRGHGAIMTLVGPPGVGKTSLGESVARAMGRSFIRIALGGVRDEAEIRGHRRTYVGSRPGRIARALTEAGTMNPVILLDEVDKMGAGGWSGDPSAALLEVLDPAQNHTFRDHYLEVDLDLSDVVFIATANVLDTIPAPLLDRMDIVPLDGYTDDEKLHIARRYLWPRQLAQSGLRDDEVTLRDEAITTIIRGYTREAGVRRLERELGRLAKKIAATVARGIVRGEDVPTQEIGPDRVTELLGRSKVRDDVPERTELPGVATGLAVTGVGGDVLFIESTAFPTGADSEPSLTLTGQLGDVMKESAQIALNYVRSHALELGIDPESLHRRFHIHVPAGAIPKDGPSAGITMTTALVSLLRDVTVDERVGMTGEITLQGAVLPIGGLKQKVLAAHRAGLTHVVLPKRNEYDLDDVPEAVRAEMTFHLAETYLDVALVAFAT